MDNIYEEYLNKLINECMQGAKFAYLPEAEKSQIIEKIRNHFYSVTINTVIDQLSDEQLLEIKDLDPESPEMEEKISMFAASIPGLSTIMEDILRKEMDQILQTGQVPES